MYITCYISKMAQNPAANVPIARVLNFDEPQQLLIPPPSFEFQLSLTNIPAPFPIVVVSGGIATEQAIEDAVNDPAGPRTPVLVPRTLRVPSPPNKRRN